MAVLLTDSGLTSLGKCHFNVLFGFENYANFEIE